MKRLAFLPILALAACSDPASNTIQGYGEAQYLYAASQDGGPIAEVLVKEGDSVAAGAILVRTDPVRAKFALDAAQATADAARARTDDGGALAEAVRQAEAQAALAAQNLARTEDLVRRGNAAKSQLDTDRAALKAANAAVAQARAERDAALRDLGTAEANAALARQKLGDTEIKAPAAGTIQRIYRRAGEIVAGGAPILALLPPANMKIRFFIPEGDLTRFPVGATVTLACDGCASGLTAKVTFVAADPQFTPPVIYSLSERGKLVFLAEAQPTDASAIRPGLPVDIALPK
ncbi:p-hydroxybenzoic acid efflux pump subunit AaeA [Alphaproteobacteria bacterium SO-S41]|nr:p-hydroxybenzoic acid efflux pump subunit AaeA [Alphaproteobacteria bacterium SO-S41]